MILLPVGLWLLLVAFDVDPAPFSGAWWLVLVALALIGAGIGSASRA